MRLLIDMNLSPRWVAFLRTKGFEADHWSGLGSPGATDHELMSWAAEHDAIVLT